MLRYFILGSLRYSGSRHGYALMKEYRERLGGHISTGSFYRELMRLEAEGLVGATTNPPEADRRRAPYEITSAGIGAFDTWMALPRSGTGGDHEDDLSIWLLFLAETDATTVQRLLERCQESLWIRSKTLEHAREIALSRGFGAKFEPLALLLARRMKHVAADLDFLEEFRLAYKSWAAKQTPETSPGPASVRRRLRRGEG